MSSTAGDPGTARSGNTGILMIILMLLWIITLPVLLYFALYFMLSFWGEPGINEPLGGVLSLIAAVMAVLLPGAATAIGFRGGRRISASICAVITAVSLFAAVFMVQVGVEAIIPDGPRTYVPPSR